MAFIETSETIVGVQIAQINARAMSSRASPPRSPSSISLWRIFPGKVETVLQLSQAARRGFASGGDALMTSTVCEIVLLTWLP
jgi:hypothetical protein